MMVIDLIQRTLFTTTTIEQHYFLDAKRFRAVKNEKGGCQAATHLRNPSCYMIDVDMFTIFLLKAKVKMESTVWQPSAGTFVADLHHNYFEVMDIFNE